MRTFSLSSFHHSLVLFLMFYEIFITIFIVLSLFLVVFFLDLHSTLDKINCLYLIFVFSRTKFVDSLSRIENKSCVSIQRVLNRALLKSNNFFSTEQNATERSWSRGLSSSAVLLNNNKTHLKITFFLYFYNGNVFHVLWETRPGHPDFHETQKRRHNDVDILLELLIFYRLFSRFSHSLIFY